MRDREVVEQVKAIFTDLGFELPEKVDELAGKSFFTEFSQEQFRLPDQELVAMYGSEQDVLANPVVKRLDAAQKDRWSSPS